MFSFLDQPLFDSNTSETKRGTPLDGAPRDSFLSAGQSAPVQQSQTPAGEAATYGARYTADSAKENTPLAAQLPESIQCRDPDSVSALERLIRVQQASDKRIATIEHRIVGMMEHLAASSRTDKRPPGLAGNTLLWIAASTALVIVVVILCRRRAAPIEVLMRAPGGALAPAPAAATPVVFAPVLTHLGPAGAPQSFLA